MKIKKNYIKRGLALNKRVRTLSRFLAWLIMMMLIFGSVTAGTFVVAGDPGSEAYLVGTSAENVLVKLVADVNTTTPPEGYSYIDSFRVSNDVCPTDIVYIQFYLEDEWEPDSDLNGDGIVNLADFGIMAEHWLE